MRGRITCLSPVVHPHDDVELVLIVCLLFHGAGGTVLCLLSDGDGTIFLPDHHQAARRIEPDALHLL